MLMKHFKFVVQRVSVRTVTTALKVICKSAPSAQKRAAAIYVRRHRDPSVYTRARTESFNFTGLYLRSSSFKIKAAIISSLFIKRHITVSQITNQKLQETYFPSHLYLFNLDVAL